MSSAADAPTGEFSTRAAKALTESMTVIDDSLDHDLRDEEFLVVTPTGTYRVDAIADTCDCPDALHRAPDEGCKHRLRVALARGERPIPGWVDRSAIDDQLGQHLAASPRIATADGRTEVFDQ
ncbi:hypothetical protein C464_06115 [Halorubrum coriense DSM 10284]|uniref:SWIM-type domain-containing protein n=1 Tax=Halorubrum coriense DSM 10284 TaxID=1227466 RepID=M0EPG3_9EURY|nr:hypothetical protein [Halorubrum coriense]ELZ48963.1 hypothetical protein C464_06115 [Halorubrum coriense DSM 10284]QRG24146.1 hypothetical protein HrrHm1_175 [Halorubrum virus Humcor1]